MSTKISPFCCLFGFFSLSKRRVEISRPAFFMCTTVYSVMVLNTLQGTPAAMLLAGILFVTTLPAPMTLFVPMVTPFRMVQFVPIQTSSSITIGALCTPVSASSA